MKKQASTYYIDEAKPIAKAIADLEGASDFFVKVLAPTLKDKPLVADYAADLEAAVKTFQPVAKLFDDYLVNDPQEIADELEMLDAIRDRVNDEHYLGNQSPAWLIDILNA